jgi:hypothetical protein
MQEPDPPLDERQLPAQDAQAAESVAPRPARRPLVQRRIRRMDDPEILQRVLSGLLNLP